MDKKDIYEHLANIYLEASSKKGKKKTRKYPPLLKNFFFFATALAFGALFFLLANLYKNFRPLRSETALVLVHDAVKMNFHFDPVKKEIYSVNLNKLDLSGYNILAFSVKNATNDQSISLKIEFTSRFNEKSEVYLKNLDNSWRDYKIRLASFKNITDWSEMTSISFIVEEWNVTDKKGVAYLDNIMLLK